MTDETEQALSATPRSVYVHIPFCRHRCGYCNFTLLANRDDLVPKFLAGLEREMRESLDSRRQVDTIFVGGGTPTHLTNQQLQQLLQSLNRWFELATDAEFSFEANPVDCSRDKLKTLAEHGVNRISLGGQSFSPRKLKLLERDHTQQQLQEAIHCASEEFDNVSLDLIFATPEESLEEWESDLQLAASSPIQHLSTYGLTIEKGSAFFGRMTKAEFAELPDEDQLVQYERAIEYLTSHGWEHYEVSNFATTAEKITQQGAGNGMSRCQHNETYWQGRHWWGFGPGAASFLPASEQGVSLRRVNHRSTTTYLKRLATGISPVAEEYILSAEQALRERLVFGLRQLEGVDLDRLSPLSGEQLRQRFEPYLTRYLESGFLEFADRRLRLTRSGLMISDSLWPDLLGDIDE